MSEEFSDKLQQVFTCPKTYFSLFISTVFEDTLKCLYQNGGCEHFCDGSGPKRKCGCAPGYALGEDGRECVAQGMPLEV